MRRKAIILMCFCLIGLNAWAQTDLYKGLEFKMSQVKEPLFPKHMVNVKEHGAVGNGLVDNTEAFSKAIDAVAKKGGGTVLIPKGIWKTGPISLKSNIRLHTEKGALVIFDDDFDKYPVVETSYEGLETYRCTSPINGKNLENVAITGEGVFDGAGDSWRLVKKSKLTAAQWHQKVKSGGVVSDDGNTWYPSEQAKEGAKSTGNFGVPDLKTYEEFLEVRDFLRPVMVSLVGCKKVLLDGPTFQNSPAWNLHPLMCEDVTLRNLTIRNPWYSQNGDGLDLESCKNVVIHDNSFDVGDDAICFKSGKNEDGLKRGMATENVIVKNNTVYHAHGGFVVGSEMSGGVKNVHVSNCTFIGTDCGLRFKSTRGRGGVVENIYISNIEMVDIKTEAIRFNLFYEGKSPVLEDGSFSNERVKAQPIPVTVTTPSFRNIYIKDITSTGSGAAAFFQGLPEMKLKEIHMENVMLEASKGITMIDAQNISLKGVEVLQKKGPALILFNGKDISLDKFECNITDQPSIKVFGDESNKIELSNSKMETSKLHLGEEVNANAVQIKHPKSN
ncbi:glycoside hydrolase family 28 protein [Limibacter armeniacum]|uniref:glycoside hydrolase family 28 protein n=1 Tax=Limibacter armeniacum TaxID=466084 RepID=UPI002FE677CC